MIARRRAERAAIDRTLGQHGLSLDDQRIKLARVLDDGGVSRHVIMSELAVWLVALLRVNSNHHFVDEALHALSTR